MAARALPNLGLQAFFDLGEDGWNDEYDLNFLMLSVLVQGGVISKVSATPGAPTDGDTHIFDETHPTQANKIAVRDDGAWVYFTPLEGWLVYNRTANYFEWFNGTVWAELTTGGGGGGPSLSTVQVEAADYVVDPADVGNYIRLTSSSAKSVTVDPESTTALPDNGEWTFRNVGAGDATFIEGSGVTIVPPNGGTLVVPQDGTVTLKRVAADEFDLMGQVIAL
jgi:hypothetical protein